MISLIKILTRLLAEWQGTKRRTVKLFATVGKLSLYCCKEGKSIPKPALKNWQCKEGSAGSMLKHSSSFAPFPPNSFYAQGLRETSPSPPLSPILSQDLDSLRVLIVRFCSETDLSP